MGEKITTAKIIVNESHELTDLVRDIHKSKADRIVLTFTEQTDLLISPINLRVLEEAAERESKLLIAQIIQNPTGIRNAKLAGLKVIDTPSAPTDYDWEEALELRNKRKNTKVEKKKEIEKDPPKEDKKEVFEERIKSTLEEGSSSKYVDRRGIKTSSFISIDKDLPSTEKQNTERVPVINTPITETPRNELRREKVSIFNKLKGLNRKGILKILLFTIVPLILISLIGALLYNQFATIAKVKIFVAAKPVEVETILTGDEDIEGIDFENLLIPIKTEEATKSLSDSVEATGKAFRGDKAKGSVTLSFYYKDDVNGCPDENPPVVTLNVGQTVTTGSLSYKVTTQTQIPCNGMSDVPVEATDIGEEFNISSGKQFSVPGYTEGFSEGEVRGLNPAAFTGGSKEEYTVLSQLDVDNAVEQLSTTAIEEVKSELRDSTSGWEIIEDSILSEVDKSSIKTDKKVGEEADTVNLDLTIKGTATYYLTTGVTEALTDLLREKAEEENLFESENDLELVLGDEIETDISVEESSKDVVKIKIIAKSSIQPDVDKTAIENTLRGMSWEEGREYINTLVYSERKSEVTFIPNNYPAFLKRFPDRRGGVMVTIFELEVDK